MSGWADARTMREARKRKLARRERARLLAAVQANASMRTTLAQAFRRETERVGA